MPMAGKAHDPEDPRHNRLIHVDLGDGAFMSVPYGYWLWRLVHCKDVTPPGISDDRSLAASVLEGYRYLITECTKEEAWRRIKLLRHAINTTPEPAQ